MDVEAHDPGCRQFLRFAGGEACSQGATVGAGGDDIGEEAGGLVGDDACVDGDRGFLRDTRADLPGAQAQ